MTGPSVGAHTRRTDEAAPVTPAEDPPPGGRRWPMLAGVAVVGIAIVLALAGGLSLLTGGGPSPSSSASPPPTSEPEGFPTEVLGMRVVTIPEALDLISIGWLDGRDAAVAGYWIGGLGMSCPYPMRQPAALERYCESSVFANADYKLWTCTPLRNGAECHGNPAPAGAFLTPYIGVDGSGGEALHQASTQVGPRSRGVPVVLIGHVGDGRQWHCPAAKQAECAQAFVIDRVAWLAGTTLDLSPARTLVPQALTLEEVVGLAAPRGEVLSVVPVEAGDAPTIDPRLHAAGRATVWIVRAFRAPDPGHAPEDPTREVDLWLIDDADGAVISRSAMETGPAYQPARLLFHVVEAARGPAGDVLPFYRVEREDGSGVQEMYLSETFGMPAVVEAGDYVVRAWRAQVGRNGVPVGEPHDDCSMDVTVAALQELRLEAVFPSAGACTLGPATFDDEDLFRP